MGGTPGQGRAQLGPGQGRAQPGPGQGRKGELLTDLGQGQMPCPALLGVSRGVLCVGWQAHPTPGTLTGEGPGTSLSTPGAADVEQ